MPCNCCEMENNTFGEDEAKANLKDYRKRGPAKQTKLILEAVRSLGLKDASLLDVGGGANEEQVRRGFEIILSDPNVRAVLVNIFGGIVQCDIIAAGILAAVEQVHVAVPVVVRLEGTNVDLGKKILADSGLTIISADNMADAAQKIVKLVA